MRVAIVAALVMAGATGAGVGEGQVLGQAASPSVRAAARLKYNPPRNWIRHYLADDRYKLMGGAWKVVSTETDTLYYPAWAPEMLSQSAGIVIGFPSAAAAEEAGYRRSKYPMESPLLGLTGRGDATPPAVPAATVATPFGNITLPSKGQGTENKGKARRITLADGASSALLLPGWTHIRHQESVPQGAAQAMQLSIFVPGSITESSLRNPRALRMVAFGFMPMPPGMAEGLAPGALDHDRRVLAGGRVDTGASRALAGVRNVTFGNMRGLSLSVPTPQLGTIPIAFGAQGNKLVLLVDTSRGARGSRQIISSFRGR